MTTTIVFIKDHVTDTVTTLTYTRDQKNVLLARWGDPDPLLVNLQHRAAFVGHTTLSELTPFHFRVLLGLNLGLFGDLSTDEKLEPRNLVMRSLDWTLMGLINCLEVASQSLLSTLTINRITSETMLVDVALSMEPIKMPRPKPHGPKLHVLIDRDRDEKS